MKREVLGDEEEEEETEPNKKPSLPRLTPEVAHEFWATHFDTVAYTLLYELGTCCGVFQFHQREICARTENPETGAEYFHRYNIFRNVREVLEYLLKVRSLSVQFAGVMPSHHLQNQPVQAPWFVEATPNAPSNHYQSRPRDTDREWVRNNMASQFGHVLIDVDLGTGEDAYDRTGICDCGMDRKACDYCWEAFMQPAMLVLDYILGDFFGFKAMFKVFSGRRGFHIWILDRRVIHWTNQQRATFALSLHTPVDGDEMSEKAYQLLTPIFDANPALVARRKPGQSHKEAVFQSLYPKIDMGVTKDSSHPHKLPLTLHPSTGNLCVAFEGSRFVYSEGCIPFEQITPYIMESSMKIIRRAIDTAREQ